MNRSMVIMALMTEDGRCRWDVRVGSTKDDDFCTILSEMIKDAGKQQQKNVLVVNPLRYRQPTWFQEIAQRRGW